MVEFPEQTMVKVSDLKPYPKNLKFHSKEQLEDISKLIDMVGFKDPIVIDSDMTIWAGHGRVEVAKMKNMKEIPAVMLKDLSEDQKKVFMLMDNKVNESPWVAENVKLIFDQVPSINFENFKLNFDTYFEKNIEIAEREWQDMPEFYQREENGFHRLMLGFATEQDMIDFAKLVNQKISLTTHYLWIPKPENSEMKNWSDKPTKQPRQDRN